ncbi:histidine kinase [Paenibacillus sp. HB172176]|uniref:sensor histidine kinase n=1 Tax=Paenibacillus sp. HB172176 TaxID=2493690 RepID=UPI00143891F1|nr:histidine kinase [Paenibacillus sp. HB172176]
MKRLFARISGLYSGLYYRQKLFAAILVLMLPPLLLLSMISLGIYMFEKKQALLASYNEQFGNEASLLDQKFYSSIEKSIYVTNNLQILLLLKQNYSSDLLAYMDNLDNVRPLLDALRSDDTHNQIHLYSFNQTIYSTDGIRKIDDLDPAVRRLVLNASNDYPVRMLKSSQETGHLEVRIYGTIMDINKPLAITEVVFPVEETFSSLREMLPSDSRIVYRMKDGTSYTIGSKGDFGDAYLVELPLKSAQDELLLYVGKTSVWLHLAPIVLLPFIMLAGLLLTIFVSIRLVSTLLTKRLVRLTGMIRGEVDSLGSDDQLKQVLGHDELGQLDRSFHRLVVHIRRHYEESAQKEVERRLLEAELLQNHINPHVLYNTLSGIKWVYQDERLHQLIDDMVEFYRLFLSRGEVEVTLAQELAMLEKYMKMHQFSYALDFNYAITTEPELNEAYLLRNLLQPIVENALLHGIHQLDSGGRVTIAARREAAQVMIEICDNGGGIDPSGKPVPSTSVSELTLKSKPSGSGYALSNIERRIKLYYGEPFGLYLESSPPTGTKATMILPFRRQID